MIGGTRLVVCFKKPWAQLFVLFLGLVIPVNFLLAAELDISSKQLEAYVGQTVSIDVLVKPDQESINTVKLGLEYSPEVFEAIDMTWAPGWLPITHSSYDMVDNDIGLLFKTAGIQSGLKNEYRLGTVTFMTKQAGEALIKISDNSLVLDQSNNNTFSASELAQIDFNIIDPHSLDSDEMDSGLVNTSAFIVPQGNLVTSKTETAPPLTGLLASDSQTNGELSPDQLDELYDRTNRRLAQHVEVDSGNLNQGDGKALFDVILEPSGNSSTPLWPFIVIGVGSIVVVSLYVVVSERRSKNKKK